MAEIDLASEERYIDFRLDFYQILASPLTVLRRWLRCPFANGENDCLKPFRTNGVLQFSAEFYLPPG